MKCQVLKKETLALHYTDGVRTCFWVVLALAVSSYEGFTLSCFVLVDIDIVPVPVLLFLFSLHCPYYSHCVIFFPFLSILGCRHSSQDYCLLLSSSLCFLSIAFFNIKFQAGPDLITLFLLILISQIGILGKMQFVLFLAIFFSLSFNALSLPVDSPNHLQGRSFKVQRIKRNGYVSHGPTALRKAYRKFGIETATLNGVDVNDFQPFETTHAAYVKVAKEENSEQTGAVDATSVDGDVEFVSPVNIGGQTFDMNFDSGSADM